MPRQHPDDRDVLPRASTNASIGDLFDQVAPAPDPRLQARAHVAGNRAANVAILLQAFRRKGPSTPDEIAQHLGWTPYYTRPRCTEMEQAGTLRDTGLRRPSVNGNAMSVLEAVP